MLSFLSLACLAGVTLGAQVPHFRQSGYGNPQPVPQPLPPSAEGLPCPSEGFYAHPKQQNRFYRCVDHAKTGSHYTVYQFHCPVGQSFVKTEQEGICVPTNVAAGEIPKVPTGTWKPKPVKPVSGYNPTMAPATIQPEPVKPVNTGSYQTGGGAYPKPGNPVTPAPQPVPTPAPTPAPQPVPAPAPGGYPGVGSNAPECPHKYVQDATHCNVYRACVADGKMYRCRTGSVFDQMNQMCRWSYRADDVCKGKTLMSETQFRSFPTSFDDYLVAQNPGLSTLIQSPLDAPVDQSMFYIGGVHNQQVPQFYVGGGLDQQASQNQQAVYSEGDAFARNSNDAQAVPTFFPSADNPLVYYF